MGLKDTRKPRTYVKLTKEGKFIDTKDESKKEYPELEGKLVDMYLKDEKYEGNDIKKLYIVLESNDEQYVLGFGFETSYTSTFINFLKNADVNDAITLVPKVESFEKDGATKTKKTMLIQQNGKWLKSFYTKEDGLVPAMTKQIINKKPVWIKDDYLQFYEDVILKDIKPKLKAPVETQSVYMTKEEKHVDANPSATLPWDSDFPKDTDVEDDLPF